MDRLPFDQQQVVVGHAYLGLRFVDIAKATGIPAGTVKSRWKAAKKRLEAILAHDNDDERCSPSPGTCWTCRPRPRQRRPLPAAPLRPRRPRPDGTRRNAGRAPPPRRSLRHRRCPWGDPTRHGRGRTRTRGPVRPQ
ncbi:RNA polymerase sigma factor [Actinomadura rubrisoli]|uniref:RNA polymerase sigma factor n=1 Tax=Actinomadura rubrisoli TaxID=2530368 RepID=UPI003C7DAB52